MIQVLHLIHDVPSEYVVFRLAIMDLHRKLMRRVIVPKKGISKIIEMPSSFRYEVYFALLLVENFNGFNAAVGIGGFLYTVAYAVLANFLAKSVVVFNVLNFF